MFKILATLIYEGILASQSKFVLRCLLKLRILLLKFANPVITLKYNSFTLSFPFSHTIFYYQKLYPQYDMQLHKIAKYIKDTFGNLNMIDVGANIGDTVVFTNIKNASYLLIEGEKSYANLISKNIYANYNQKISIKEASMGGG